MESAVDILLALAAASRVWILRPDLATRPASNHCAAIPGPLSLRAAEWPGHQGKTS